MHSSTFARSFGSVLFSLPHSAQCSAVDSTLYFDLRYAPLLTLATTHNTTNNEKKNQTHKQSKGGKKPKPRNTRATEEFMPTNIRLEKRLKTLPKGVLCVAVERGDETMVRSCACM